MQTCSKIAGIVVQPLIGQDERCFGCLYSAFKLRADIIAHQVRGLVLQNVAFTIGECKQLHAKGKQTVDGAAQSTDPDSSVDLANSAPYVLVNE